MDQGSDKGGVFLDDGSVIPGEQTESEFRTVTAPPMSARAPNKRPIKTALHQAVIDCRLHQVRLLVSKHGANVNCKDMYGRTPMMLVSIIEEEFGYRMAKILLGAGAHLNPKDNLGRSALSYACMNGREEIVNMIVQEDVLDINEGDNDGYTPLHHAAQSGNPKIVKVLVNCFVRFGLDIDTRNSLGYTALLLACKNGHFTSSHILIKKGGANPSLKDNEVYLNAQEWAQRSSNIQNKVTWKRSILPPAVMDANLFSFSRESTMYQRNVPSTCQHGRNNPRNFSWSTTGLRLPAVFSSNASELERSETFIDGKDARQVVLNEIEDYEAQSRPHSQKKVTIKKFNHPPTAKLLSLSRRSKTAIIPDMTTIFRIYSDQYQPDWKAIRNNRIRKATLYSSASSRTMSELQVES